MVWESGAGCAGLGSAGWVHLRTQPEPKFWGKRGQGMFERDTWIRNAVVCVWMRRRQHVVERKAGTEPREVELAI